MNKLPSRNILSLILIFLFVSFTLAACSSPQPASNPPATQAQNAPATQVQSAPVTLDGATLVKERCSVCHSLDRIHQAHKTSAEWTTTVTRMVKNGANLNQAEVEAVLQFLAQAYP
jgi:cytochrome c5